MKKLKLQPKNKYHFSQLMPGIPVTWEFEDAKEAERCYRAAWAWKRGHMTRDEMKITKKRNKVTCERMAY